MKATSLLLSTVFAISGLVAVAGCTGDDDDDHTVVSVAVSPLNPTVAVGTSLQFAAVATLGDGHQEDVTAASTWTSSSAGVASISATGLAATLTTGQTIITADHDGVTGTSTLTVTTGS